MPASNYGFHFELDDTLQIQRVPHVWLFKAKDTRINALSLFPAFAEQYDLRCNNTLLNRSYIQ